MLRLTSICSSSLLSICWLIPTSAIAQVTSDNTLSTTVDSADGQFTINNGDRAGNNLFHSFQEFSVPENGSATFNNAADISNIFSRVTGGNISQIEGAINANGGANLLLINPAGIVFGENASLNIGGSFFATTGDSLLFEGGEFSAVNSEAASILTINRPIGLNFGDNPGSIINRAGTLTDPIAPPPGLQVQPGQNITLVGGEIQLEGGFLTASGGKIELGSVAKAIGVEFDLANSNNLNYEADTNFGNIQLSDLSRIDTSGLGGGEVRIRGQNVVLTGGSKIISDTFGDLSGGNITITASDTLQILGTTNIPGLFEPVDAQFGSFVPLQSSISANTSDNGDAGDIAIATGQLILSDGAQINTFTFALSGVLADSPGSGGNITIDASEAVTLDGVVSVIGEEDVFGLDRFGVEINGVSSLGTITANGSRAGNLIIDTAQLTVKNGAIVTTNSFAEGKGGELTINATESVTVTGTSPSGIVPSAIVSSSVTTGTAGNIEINGKKTTVQNGGQIAVGNLGTGQAGDLELDTQNLLLDNGTLSAATQAGDRGNINVIDADTIFLRNGSSITTSATQLSTGGDININSGAIAIDNSSNITAIAEAGRGGNIQINSQALFREPNAQITAASNLGIDGTITFNTPDVDPTSGIVELPSVPIDAEAILAQDLCKVEAENIAGGSSSFMVTGRGGLTPTSAESLENRDRVVGWTDESAIEVTNSGAIAVTSERKISQIQQAQGLTVANGSLWLTANPTNGVLQSTANHPDCNS